MVPNRAKQIIFKELLKTENGYTEIVRKGGISHLFTASTIKSGIFFSLSSQSSQCGNTFIRLYCSYWDLTQKNDTKKTKNHLQSLKTHYYIKTPRYTKLIHSTLLYATENCTVRKFWVVFKANIIVLTICHNLCCLSQLVAMLLATIYVATGLCSGYREFDCLKSLRIQNYSGLHFSRIRTE